MLMNALNKRSTPVTGILIKEYPPCSLITLLLVLVVVVSNVSAQRGEIRVMFYNVENLFDTIDNPFTHDEEFLPGGDKRWDSYRYWKKIKRTYQVIAALGENEPPEIIGVCEVEDFLPLYHIINNTPLSKYPYTVVHKNSPDRRGIDAAIIYRNDKLKLLSSEFIEIIFPDDTARKTREIAYASFLYGTDTLHAFINHWPSRRGGQAFSEQFRVHVAEVLSSKIDSIQAVHNNAKILIAGDFNDEPHNNSLQVLVKKGMQNLSEGLKEKCKCGTYKFRTQWNMLDQMLVSNSLLSGTGLTTSKKELTIFNADFLIENDDKNGGQKPYRTYLGPTYIGGFSDHLPIYLDLFTNNK